MQIIIQGIESIVLMCLLAHYWLSVTSISYAVSRWASDVNSLGCRAVHTHLCVVYQWLHVLDTSLHYSVRLVVN